MKKYWVKFGNRQAVHLYEQYFPDPSKHDICDLVIVCLNNKELIGIPKDSGPITVHLPLKHSDASDNMMDDSWFSNDNRSHLSIEGLSQQLNMGLSLATLAPFGNDISSPFIIRLENHQYSSVQYVIQDFLKLPEFSKIKSASNEDLTRLKSTDSLLSHEVAQIESWPLFDKTMELNLEKIGITLPYKKVVASDHKTTVMIGVSGCGKSRTCVDILSHTRGLYFEVGLQRDLDELLLKLKDFNKEGRQLESYTSFLFSALFLARISILNNLEMRHLQKYVSYQITPSFQISCLSLFKNLIEKCDHQDVETALKKVIADYAIVIDEAQQLMHVLTGKYRNSNDEINRSLFRFLVSFVHSFSVKSYWCGTQIRLKDVSQVISAAAQGKPADAQIFTDFHHYSYDELFKYLKIKLGAKSFNRILKSERDAVMKACYMLQGRSRLLAAFCLDLERAKISYPKESFGDVLDAYLDSIINSFSRFSFGDYWRRVINEEAKVRDITKTPDIYVFELLLNYAFREQNENYCAIAVDNDIDLIKTALVSLRRLDGNHASYTMAEPAVFEAALHLIRNDSNFKTRFLNACSKKITETPADARSNMIPKFVALRFRMGWWKNIPDSDPAWEEIPLEFRSLVKSMKISQYLIWEPNADSDFLALTCCQPDPLLYVMPAEKNGPDGCYGFIGYFGKSSLAHTNQSGDPDVVSTERKKTDIYTSIKNWFKPIRNIRKSFSELNQERPMIFICAELPFYDPAQGNIPDVKQVANNNTVIYLDLRSRLAHYLFGKELIYGFYKLASENQKKFCPTVWPGNS